MEERTRTVVAGHRIPERQIADTGFPETEERRKIKQQPLIRGGQLLEVLEGPKGEGIKHVQSEKPAES